MSLSRFPPRSIAGRLRCGAVGALALALWLLPQPAICDDGLGYTDTPLLPNSPWRVHDRQRPQPPTVTPGDNGFATPPADAIVLFDGKDLSQWQGGDPKGIEHAAINILKTGELSTKRHFSDCQLHVEWAAPEKPDNDAMNWGNSGVSFLGRYELQIIESHDHKIYADGIAGAVYGQTPPLVNASRKPGQWESYDVVFTAPRFDGQRLIKPAYFTVFWNGVLVQDHTASLGPTKHRLVATYDSRETTGPITLQYHHSAVRFRNIWVRALQPTAPLQH
ncbi:MAG: DUF1080 domain-containing protein [Planctomycetaceae bacterium]|nr:DUF1080 domain-containing protein [Planctomycetaceae bacterium]